MALSLWWTPAQADLAALRPWVEMSALCEALLTEQSETVINGFAAQPVPSTGTGLDETVISHPDAPIMANAFHDGASWVTCTIRSDPPLPFDASAGFVAAWLDVQRGLAKAPGYHSVVFDSPVILQPVRVACPDDGRLIAVFGFVTEAREFRLGVAGRLPPDVASPCG